MIGLKVFRLVGAGAGAFTYLYKDEAFNRAISQVQQNVASTSIPIIDAMTDHVKPENHSKSETRTTEKKQLAKLLPKDSELDEGTVSDEKIDFSSVSDFLVQMNGGDDTIIRQLRLAPLQPHEVEGAIEVLQGSPGLVDIPNLPSKLNEQQKIFQQVKKVLKNVSLPDVQEIIVKKERETKKVQPNFIVSSPTQPEVDEWEKLAMRFHCVICKDVKAAPFVCSCCAIDYCYECLDNYKNIAKGEDDSMEIFPHCPACREPITEAIHNRSLDDIIQEEVDKLPDSEKKREWERRCQVYDEFVSEGRKRQREKNSRKRAESSQDEWDGQFYASVTVFIAAAVIALIMASRQKK